MAVAPYFAKMNYWALILGGSSGLGLASAHKLSEEGMNLFLVHRDRKKNLPQFEKEKLRMESQGVMVMSYNGDATRSEKREEAIRELELALSGKGKLRLLLHSISRGSLRSLSGEGALSGSDLEITLDSMAYSWLHWVRALKEKGLFAEDARSLAFTSEGSQRAWEGYAAVSAAKSALESLGRSMALELAGEGIRTNVIQAGMTRTPSFEMIPGHERLAENAIERNPFGRLTQAEDVANMVYLLCRDEAAWVNGAIIPVDGGEKNT